MKKLLVVLLSVLMMFTFTGCSSDDTDDGESETSNLYEEILERGYIVVGIEGDWSPWCYYDEDNNLTGFEVELAKLAAAELGVDVQFEEAPFDSLLIGVNTGTFDVICNGVGWTEDRAEAMDFTDPYAYDKTVLIVSSDNTDITSFEDLDGKQTGNSEGSTYALLAEEYGASVVTIDKFAETIIALGQGRIDATINSSVSLADYLSQQPDAEIKVVDETEESQPICWPVNKGETELVEALNAALETLRENGTIAQLSEQFFGMDITE